KRSDDMTDPKDLSRREFVTDAGRAAIGTVAAVAAPLAVPSRVLGRGRRAPNDTVNVAIVGFGGMGCQDALVLAQTEHIGAICDVDVGYTEHTVSGTLTSDDGKARPDGLKLQEQFRKAKRYTDFRELLTKE